MNRVLSGLKHALAIYLGLTMAANAMPGNLPTNPLASRPHNPSLWMVQAPQSDAGKTFGGVGVVTAIQPAGTLTINHEPIEGLMPAMEMMFSVNPHTLTKGVRPGDKVEFRVNGKTYTIVALSIRGHLR